MIFQIDSNVFPYLDHLLRIYAQILIKDNEQSHWSFFSNTCIWTRSSIVRWLTTRWISFLIIRRWFHIRCGEFLLVFSWDRCWSFIRSRLSINRRRRFLRTIIDRISIFVRMFCRWFIIRTISIWIRRWNGTSIRWWWSWWLIMHLLENTNSIENSSGRWVASLTRST